MVYDNIDIDSIAYNELKSGSYLWWNNIINDNELYVKIGKNNYINIYYNGGALVRNLKWNKSFTGEIHKKYAMVDEVDIDYSKGYYKLHLHKDNISYNYDFNYVKDNLIHFNNLNKDSLLLFKNNINLYFKKIKETEIQYRYANLDQYIIDAELLFYYSTQIDLIRIDKSCKKIVTIEVKRIDDGRWNDINKEMVPQLENYYKGNIEYKKELLIGIAKVLKIKQNLGIFKDTTFSINEYTIEPYPLLLIVRSNEEKMNEHLSKYYSQLEKHIYGIIYTNKYINLDLMPRFKNNKIYSEFE